MDPSWVPIKLPTVQRILQIRGSGIGEGVDGNMGSHVSMYGIFTYIWLISMVNVGRYTIHGSTSFLNFSGST